MIGTALLLSFHSTRNKQKRPFKTVLRLIDLIQLDIESRCLIRTDKGSVFFEEKRTRGVEQRALPLCGKGLGTSIRSAGGVSRREISQLCAQGWTMKLLGKLSIP